MNFLIDKKVIIQLFGNLMLNPSLMSESDKYNLVAEDFNTTFEKYIYASIYNLYVNGAETILPQDIDNYLSDKPNCYAIFEKEKGIAFLQDAIDLAQPDNFDYYYKKFKKLKLIQDLKVKGYPTENIYCENLLSSEAEKINEEFEKLTIKDILDKISGEISVLENKYKTDQESKSYKISDGIDKLLVNLKETPDIGSKLQGKIFNTVVRGARRGKYYICSMGSGVGKTRTMIGHICGLAFPFRYDDVKGWEVTGNSEKCLYFATEQELEEIQTLVLAYLSNINEELILNGQLTPELEVRVNQAAQILKEYENNLIVVHMPDPSIDKIRAKVRYHYFHDSIENLFYDYIFSSPALLNEYRDLRIREDVILGMLSTALKNIAVEFNIFVMTATQLNDVNSEAGKRKEVKNQSLIRGSKAIIDKADMACIGAVVSNDELELLGGLRVDYSQFPNLVIDVYKNRRSQYNQVRIWSLMDLGTCRKQDLFITNARYQEVTSFQVLDLQFEYLNISQYKEVADKLNKELNEKNCGVTIDEDGVVTKKEEIDWSAMF